MSKVQIINKRLTQVRTEWIRSTPATQAHVCVVCAAIPFSRALMREHTLTPADLIQPVFVIEGDKSDRNSRVHARC